MKIYFSLIKISSYSLPERDGRTGLNAPLYSGENDTKENMEHNQDWSVNYWQISFIS